MTEDLDFLLDMDRLDRRRAEAERLADGLKDRLAEHAPELLDLFLAIAKGEHPEASPVQLRALVVGLEALGLGVKWSEDQEDEG